MAVGWTAAGGADIAEKRSSGKAAFAEEVIEDNCIVKAHFRL